MVWNHAAVPHAQSVDVLDQEICRYRERIDKQGESSLDLADKVCP